jgi:hypothetical protein
MRRALHFPCTLSRRSRYCAFLTTLRHLHTLHDMGLNTRIAGRTSKAVVVAYFEVVFQDSWQRCERFKSHTKVFLEIADFWTSDRFLDSWIRRWEVSKSSVVRIIWCFVGRWMISSVQHWWNIWQGKTRAVRIIICYGTSLSITNPKECELFHFDFQYDVLLRFMNNWPYSWNSVYF